ncbi:MAG: hypothetical protein AB7U99_09255, partial [Steroidobacteraceae bacterium]
LTAYLAYDLHYGHSHDWGPGAGKTPPTLVAAYLDVAYNQGHGVEAAQMYFLPTTVDHNPESADRRDGPPIKHEIKELIGQGLTVAVYHHIEAAHGEPAMDAVDFYKTKNGRILERFRISQFASAAVDSQAVPAAPAAPK